MKETILFVDDDADLLQGLQRMLRSKRSEWEMTFVAGGRQALEAMEKAPFDVVVTDMRMPEIDGAELLTHVKKLCPKSVRVILSGQAELDTILRAVGCTHQYLAKPCDPESLKATIEHAVQLRNLMNNKGLEEFISQLEVLPSEPALYDEFQQEIRSDKPSLERLGTTIARDVGMAAKVLQLVNSAFFGPKREILNIHEAVGILGLDLMRELVLTKEIFSDARNTQLGGLRLDELNRRSISVGNYALRVATIEGLDRGMAESCSTTGLLHDVGKIVLSMYEPEKYSALFALANEDDCWIERELALFGTTHCAVGAYLLGLWGLPPAIIDAAAHHHPESMDNIQNFTILTALQAANLLANTTQFPSGERLENFLELRTYSDLLKKAYARDTSMKDI